MSAKPEGVGQKEACIAGSTLICRLSSIGQDKQRVSAADYSTKDTFPASGTPGWLDGVARWFRVHLTRNDSQER